MLAGGAGEGDMSLRVLALLLAALLAVPATIALLRPRHQPGAAAEAVPPRPLDRLWAVVPAALLALLAALSAAA
jgi:hypothetical protein